MTGTTINSSSFSNPIQTIQSWSKERKEVSKTVAVTSTVFLTIGLIFGVKVFFFLTIGYFSKALLSGKKNGFIPVELPNNLQNYTKELNKIFSRKGTEAHIKQRATQIVSQKDVSTEEKRKENLRDPLSERSYLWLFENDRALVLSTEMFDDKIYLKNLLTFNKHYNTDDIPSEQDLQHICHHFGIKDIQAFRILLTRPGLTPTEYENKEKEFKKISGNEQEQITAHQTKEKIEQIQTIGGIATLIFFGFIPLLAYGIGAVLSQVEPINRDKIRTLYGITSPPLVEAPSAAITPPPFSEDESCVLSGAVISQLESKNILLASRGSENGTGTRYDIRAFTRTMFNFNKPWHFPNNATEVEPQVKTDVCKRFNITQKQFEDLWNSSFLVRSLNLRHGNNTQEVRTKAFLNLLNESDYNELTTECEWPKLPPRRHKRGFLSWFN